MNPAIPRVNFERVLSGAVRRAGEVWPCDKAIQGVFIGGIASALRAAWREFPWPDLIVTAETEPYDGAWNETDEFSTDGTYWWGGVAWLALDDSGPLSAGGVVEPGTDDAFWQAASELDNPVFGMYLNLVRPEDVVGVYEDNPLLSAFPRKMRWTRGQGVYSGDVMNTGIRIFDNASRTDVNSVWVQMLEALPDLECVEYDEDDAYIVGDVIWFPKTAVNGTGEVYVCLEAAAAGENPDTDEDKWEEQIIPGWFEDYLKQSAVAAFLEGEKGDGPQSKAARRTAQESLEREIRLFQEQDQRRKP